MTIPRLDNLDRNILMNGALDFAQRNVGPVTINSTPSYETVDRWEVSAIGTFTVLQSLRALSSPSKKSKYSHEFNFRRNATTGQFIMSQKVESIVARNIVGLPVSLLLNQFFSELPTNVAVRISTADVEDDFSAVTSLGTFNFSNINTTISQWNEETLNNIITLPIGAERGFQVEIVADFASATDGADQTYRLGEIKLAIGLEAQKFSLAGRDWVEELQLCQRYFTKTYKLEDSVGTVTGNTAIMMTGIVFSLTVAQTRPFVFPVTMRQVPIITKFNPFTGAVTTTFRRSDDVNNATYASEQVSELSLSAGADGGTLGFIYIIHATADAEL